jgi:transposase InsO family protein
MFGLSNMTDHCQRVVSQLLAGIPEARGYVDNVIIATIPDCQRHAEVVVKVIDHLTSYNVWLNIEHSSRQVLSLELTALGHRVDARGLSLDLVKVDAVGSWERPTTVAEMSRFLGFCGFLRGNLRHYAELVQPMQRLLALAPDRKNAALDWKLVPEAADSFLQLKAAVATAPCVSPVDWTKAMSLVMDASTRGIGAVLYQPMSPADPPEEGNIISFSSRALLKHERGYPAYKLELLALVYSLVVYEHYLAGRRFTVLTDHRALTFLLTQAGTNRTLSNWLSLLLEFDFEVIHIPGYLNVLADFLSRAYSDLWGVGREADRLRRSGAAATQPKDFATVALGMLTRAQIRAANKTKQGLSEEAGAAVEAEAHSKSAEGVSRAEPVVEGVPEIKTAPEPRRPTPAQQQVVSFGEAERQAQRIKVEEAHSFGHFGVAATTARLKMQGESFPGMWALVEEVLQDCSPCRQWTRAKHRFAPLRDTSPRVRAPMQQVQCDFITSLGRSSDGYVWLLLYLCVFSGFVLLRPMKDKEADSVARVLWAIFCDFGPPEQLFTDNEPTLISAAVERITELHGVEHKTIAAGVSRMLGAGERSVDTATITVHKMVSQTGSEWPTVTPMVQLAMNSRAQARSGTLPFEIMFNRQMGRFQAFRDVSGLAPADLGPWIKHQQRVYSQLFPTLTQKVTQAKRRAREQADKKRRPAKLVELGSVVMRDDDDRASKNHPPFVGPFTVCGLAAEGLYYLRDGAGRILEKPVPVDKLKVLHHSSGARAWLPPPSVEAKTSLGKDEFYVDRLLRHRRRGGDHQYLVLWKGYPESEATWEPAASLPDSLIADYMRTCRQLPRRQ